MNSLLISISLIISILQICNAQTFGDKKYYLVDSLDLNTLSKKDRNDLDSMLAKFHNTEKDSIKLASIYNLRQVNNNNDLNLKYNQWMLSFTDKKLLINSKKEPNSIYLVYKGLSLNGIAISLRKKGKYKEAMTYYLESIPIQEKVGNKNGVAATLNNISLLYRLQEEYDSAIIYGKRALEYVEQNNTEILGLGYSHLNLGTVYFETDQVIECINHLEKAYEISQKINSEALTSTSLAQLGLVYKYQGMLVKSLECYFEALAIAEKREDHRGAGKMLLNIGKLYTQQKEYDLSLKYYNLSLKEYETISDSLTMRNTLMAISDYYKTKKQYQKAIEYQNKSLNLNINSKWHLMHNLFNLGDIHEQKGELHNALIYYEKALNISRKNNYQRYTIEILKHLGQLNFKKENFNTAFINYNESLQLAQKIGYPQYIVDATEGLNKIYEKNGNWKEAWKMQKLHFFMKDSLNNIENRSTLLKRNTKYELEKKDKEITLLNSERKLQKLSLQKNKVVTRFISLGLVLTVILVILAYRAYINKQKLARILSNQNEEKQAMLKEIHHRVKNNLQVVRSLLKLQSKNIEDQNIVALFEEAQNRVLSMALLHERMYNSDNLKHIDIKEHISLLSEDLIKTYAIDKKIKLITKIDENDINLRTLVPLGLLINEFISNSLKHAFKGHKKGEIMIQLKNLGNHAYELIFADNGVGFVLNKENLSMGSKLIDTFVRQLEGTLEKMDYNGTMFKIAFKDYS